MNIVILLFLALFLACGGAFGYAILQPLLRATRGRRCRTRFFTSDLIWLTLMLQFPLAFLSFVGKWHGANFALPLGLILVAVSVYVWLRCAAALSSLGIDGPLRRGLFLVIVLPMATFGAVVAAVGIPFGIMMIVESNSVAQRSDAAAGLVAAVALCYGCRRLTAWIIADPARDADTPTIEKLPE